MPEPRIGGVPERELAMLFADNGMPDQAGLGRVARFISDLTRLIVHRIAQGETEDGAVFLLAHSVTDLMKTRTGDPKTALRNGNDPISGKVWLLNASLANAHALNLAWTTGGSFSMIVDDGLGDLPAITVDLRNPQAGAQLLFFPNGCGDPEEMLVVSIADGPIAPDEMKATLDRFFEDNLRTPMTVLDGHGERIWNDASKGVPADRPEERIERRLLDRLRSVYPSHRSRAEVRTDDGFLDITIVGPDRSLVGDPVWRCDWVLELKALADRTASGNRSTADHPAAIAKGLRQAIAYGQDQSALGKALCIYDMRDPAGTDDEVFADFNDDARNYQVHLWRWRLLRSAEEGRRARYPLQVDQRRDGPAAGNGEANA